jgi:hypothetical protein
MTKVLANLGAHVSAYAGSVMHARTKGAAKLRAGLTFAATGALFVASTTGIAQATDLDTYTQNVGERTNSVVDVITYIAYVGGAALAALGIVDLKKHVENPSQTPMKNGLAKLGFGGMLLALPFLAGVAQETMIDGQQVQYETWDSKPYIGN